MARRASGGVLASTSAAGEQPVVAGHPVPRRLVRRRCVVDDGVDRRGRLLDREADALAGQGVLVPGRVAHQQHPSRDAAGNHLAQRAATAGLPAAGALESSGQPGKPGQVGAARGQDRHADQVRFHRRHVRLTPARPVHLDEVRPRRHLEVPPHAVAPRLSGRRGDADGAPHRRMQPVGRHQIFRVHPGGRHPVRVLPNGGDLRPDPFRVLLFGPRFQRRVQGGPSHAPARPVAKPRLRPTMFAHVGDPVKGHAGRVDAERRQLRQAARHQPLAARLVDGALSRLDHDHRKSLAASV